VEARTRLAKRKPSTKNRGHENRPAGENPKAPASSAGAQNSARATPMARLQLREPLDLADGTRKWKYYLKRSPRP